MQSDAINIELFYKRDDEKQNASILSVCAQNTFYRSSDYSFCFLFLETLISDGWHWEACIISKLICIHPHYKAEKKTEN